jgi:hypothetical protein
VERKSGSVGKYVGVINQIGGAGVKLCFAFLKPYLCLKIKANE